MPLKDAEVFPAIPISLPSGQACEKLANCLQFVTHRPMRESKGSIHDPPARSPVAAPASVELLAVSRHYRGVAALDNVTLSVRPGEFFSLLGQSGCGKTTLLRLVAGLDHPDSGTIRIGNDEATHTPAHRRPVNTVFQSYALFPHLNVEDNIAFGLRIAKVPTTELRRRVHHAMELVNVTDLRQRRPDSLSGGQRQRVALARALVNEPAVLLLDEPLGALDLKLRRQLQSHLRALQQQLGTTFVYVTHDQEEALALSDRMAIMREGRIEQVGTPSDLYRHPRNRFIASFLGGCNFIDATVRQCVSDRLECDTELGLLQVPLPSGSTPPSLGSQVILGIRPEQIQLLGAHHDGARLSDALPGKVHSHHYGGSSHRYEVLAAQRRFEVWQPDSAEAQHLTPARDVRVRFPADALFLLES